MAECPIGLAMVDVNEGVASCTSGGNSPRMGCVYCTLVKNDNSLINLAKDYEELIPYVEMRKVFKQAQDIR